jgi:hypothetical protein
MSMSDYAVSCYTPGARGTYSDEVNSSESGIERHVPLLIVHNENLWVHVPFGEL